MPDINYTQLSKCFSFFPALTLKNENKPVIYKHGKKGNLVVIMKMKNKISKE